MPALWVTRGHQLATFHKIDIMPHPYSKFPFLFDVATLQLLVLPCFFYMSPAPTQWGISSGLFLVLFATLSISFPSTALFSPFFSTTVYMLRSPGPCAKDSQVHIGIPTSLQGSVSLFPVFLTFHSVGNITDLTPVSTSAHLISLNNLFPLMTTPSFLAIVLKGTPNTCPYIQSFQSPINST